MWEVWGGVKGRGTVGEGAHFRKGEPGRVDSQGQRAAAGVRKCGNCAGAAGGRGSICSASFSPLVGLRQLPEAGGPGAGLRCQPLGFKGTSSHCSYFFPSVLLLSPSRPTSAA